MDGHRRPLDALRAAFDINEAQVSAVPDQIARSGSNPSRNSKSASVFFGVLLMSQVH